MNNRRRCVAWLIALAVLVLPGVAAARVELPRLFSDGAVVQRDQPMRVWGSADAGAEVYVDFNGNAVNVMASDDGRWSATLRTTSCMASRSG